MDVLLFFITQKAHSVREGTKTFLPGHFSQAALQVMPEEDQEKLLREGNPFLLTEAALRKHDISTGVLQLREFACESCDRFWWKTVPCTKPVSKCFKCKIKYDALSREKEFGIGRYRCTNCKNTFFSRCEATSERPCFNCDFTVRAPYIHPKFKPVRKHRQPIDPSTSLFEPPKHKKVVYLVHDPSLGRVMPMVYYIPLETKPRKKVVNPSTIHESTGSTASTFITQVEFPASVLEPETAGIVPVVISDPESDDEDIIVCGSSSDSESGEESVVTQEFEHESTTDIESTASAMAGSDSSSDSDDPYPKVPHKRLAPSSSSDSDSDQDADEKPSKAQLSRQSSMDSHTSVEKESTSSSAGDSGLGTAGSGSLDTGSSAPTRSTSGSDHGKQSILYILCYSQHLAIHSAHGVPQSIQEYICGLCIMIIIITLHVVHTHWI